MEAQNTPASAPAAPSSTIKGDTISSKSTRKTAQTAHYKEDGTAVWPGEPGYDEASPTRPKRKETREVRVNAEGKELHQGDEGYDDAQAARNKETREVRVNAEGKELHQGDEGYDDAKAARNTEARTTKQVVAEHTEGTGAVGEPGTKNRRVGDKLSGAASNLANRIDANMQDSGRAGVYAAKANAQKMQLEEAAGNAQQRKHEVDKEKEHFEHIKNKDEHLVAGEDAEASANQADYMARKNMTSQAGSGAAAEIAAGKAEDARQGQYGQALTAARNRRDQAAKTVTEYGDKSFALADDVTERRGSANIAGIDRDMNAPLIRDDERAINEAQTASDNTTMRGTDKGSTEVKTEDVTEEVDTGPKTEEVDTGPKTEEVEVEQDPETREVEEEVENTQVNERVGSALEMPPGDFVAKHPEAEADVKEMLRASAANDEAAWRAVADRMAAKYKLKPIGKAQTHAYHGITGETGGFTYSQSEEGLKRNTESDARLKVLLGDGNDVASLLAAKYNRGVN